MSNTHLQSCAPTPGEHSVPCTRCGGTGIYHTYGACWRCGGTGLVSPARITAFFIQQPVAETPEPPPTIEDGRAIAKAAAKTKAHQLREAGYRGRIRAFPDRVELLARHRSRPGETLHLTWHPAGFEEEWLDGPPAKNWPHILAG